MTGILLCLKNWFWVLVLLAVTLWFPSTREAQTLCWRWLLHLNGKTFVQMQAPGMDFVFFPSVQLTPEYARELRSRSTNSPDDFALAFLTGTTAERFQISLPPVECSWTNNPLLPWMTFRMKEIAMGEDGTNTITQASLNSLLPMIHLAEMSDPSNGAFAQAEACLEFAAHDPQAALGMLRTSCRNRNCNAGTTAAFSHLTGLFEQAGLSELDAVLDATYLTSDYRSTEGQNAGFLDKLMIGAVDSGNTNDFSRLLQLLVELRRMDWTDRNFYASGYRRYTPSAELIQVMAAQMNTHLPSRWTDLTYEERKKVLQPIFQDYSSRYAGPVTAAIFDSQAEAFEAEKKMRSQLIMSDCRAYNQGMFYHDITSVFTTLMLTLLCLALAFEILIGQLGKRTEPPRRWPREPKFWLFALLVVIFGAAVFTNFMHGLGAGVQVGFGLPEPSNLIGSPVDWNVLLIIFLIFCLFFSIRLLWLLMKWKRGNLPIVPWKAVHFYAVAYLISLIVMAFFRHQFVQEITERYNW